MANITELLAAILAAKKGEQVRGSIHDAIEQCYQDGKAGVNDLEGRRLTEQAMRVNEEQAAAIEALAARLDEIEGGGGEGGESQSTTIDVPTITLDFGSVRQDVAANASAQVPIMFAETFTEPPAVLCMIEFRNGVNTYYHSLIAAPIKNTVTTTGFTLGIGNKYTATLSPTVFWVAFEKSTVTIDTDITVTDGMSEAEIRAFVAPIQASLDGIKTGYDGTVYTTPGEAVREQINDLHVLIGDTPGTAIQASAVAYNDSNVGTELTNINGRLDKYEDELGYADPDTYTGTITEANTYTRIAENLSFDLATGYKFTFKIDAPLNTDVYFYLMREAESQLFSKTISPGATSAERIYTTSASVAVTAGYITVRANATDVNVEVEIEPATGTPSRIDTLEQTAQTHGTAIENLTGKTTVLESEVQSIDVSVNRLNPFTVTTGKYINTSGTSGNSASLLYTDYIKVNPGERVNLVNNGVCDTNTRFRYLTAYDSEKVVIPASGKETSYRYDVPEGVSFIIMTLYATDYAGGKLAININAVLAYSAYGDAFPIVNFAQKLKQYPYSALPDYVLGGAWYKPLGSLSKGYFCFVTDDGRIGMNEYTIPTLVIGKGVKCTFAIMSNSEVMADAEKIAVVKDAVDNYGCSVAQHGGNRWTSFDEYQLNAFFDTEKAFFDGIGIEVRGAVIPEHYNSKLIYAVAGGKYGVVRSGYDGHIYPTVCPYANYSNGPRSNLYGLTSYNIVDKTLVNNKAAVDSALANHYLMIVYIHENSLDAAKKAVIEGLMDYVNETGITQVTLGDIPNLI